MSSEENHYLVCGADSLVGKSLVNALNFSGKHVCASTRRKDSASGGRVYLDLEKPETYKLPKGVNYVFVVAAATNYERCERDLNARKVNAYWTPLFVCSALEQGAFVTFISTNAVFGGEFPWPHEDDPHAPGMEYARQKHDAEVAILKGASELKATDRLNIVRLTKILAPDTSPLPAWRSSWQRGEIVQPFSDLIFSPMSEPFVGLSLARIGEVRVPGNLHLSGAENVSYVDLAYGLARRLEIAPSLISPTTSTEKGVCIPFKPKFSGLGMVRTEKLCGVTPQGLESVIEDLSAAYGAVSNS